MLKTRIGLRLLLLLSIAASLLLAWLGITSDLRKLEQQDAATSEWKNLGEASRIELRTDGQLFGAQIHSGHDMELLQSNFDCFTLEFLGIYSPEAYGKFRPEKFNSVTQLHLANAGLTAERLEKALLLNKLDKMVLTQAEGDDLSAAWKGLERLTNLKTLILFVGPQVSFSDFPAMEDLRTLVLSSPDATAEQARALRGRLPNCTVIRRE